MHDGGFSHLDKQYVTVERALNSMKSAYIDKVPELGQAVPKAELGLGGGMMSQIDQDLRSDRKHFSRDF
jgi:hypothetical protein